MIGLPALFAVADYPDSGGFLVVDSQPDRIVLGVLQCLAGQQPVGTGAVVIEPLGVQRHLVVEPRRLGHAAHHRGFERLSHLFHDPAEEFQSVASDDLLHVFVRMAPSD